LYLNRKFHQDIAFGPQRSAIMHVAGDADRLATRVKRKLYTTSKNDNASRVMADAARTRIRCPLLDAEDRCQLYEHRPITCRLYGVPAAIAGEAHVCGKSAFRKGRAYPTVALEKIQDRLAAMSLEIAQTLGTRFKELHLVYVPVSMALLTRYDAHYLGIDPAKPES
jgi:Fe-S-cluster containining protein